ncbi:MAG: TIGR03905 family TSCPD domain-containing protein [Clostridia bacterium]|nr:TIGR03905 family TSCPD domain-containing protein [Clostridia bacterium]
MKYQRKNQGTCSRTVSFDLSDNGIVSNVSFEGGCHGNLQGIAALCEGKNADELITALSGIKCGFKQTSCPDQLAKALLDAKNSLE